MSKFFYAVRKGRIPGIYTTWPDCQAQVLNFAGAEYKKFSTLLQAKSFISPSPLSSSKGYSLFFDGGSRNNPGIAGCGVVLYNKDKIIASSYRFLGFSTSNNVAEYQALILGLNIALSEGIKTISIYGDSALVVHQVKGDWKTIHPDMIALCQVAQSLLKHFTKVTFKHIDRAQNAEADQLSNLAMDLPLTNTF